MVELTYFPLAFDQLVAWRSRHRARCSERRRLERAWLMLLADERMSPIGSRLTIAEAQVLSYMQQRGAAFTVRTLGTRLNMVSSEVREAVWSLLRRGEICQEDIDSEESYYRARSDTALAAIH